MRTLLQVRLRVHMSFHLEAAYTVLVFRGSFMISGAMKTTLGFYEWFRVYSDGVVLYTWVDSGSIYVDSQATTKVSIRPSPAELGGFW